MLVRPQSSRQYGGNQCQTVRGEHWPFQTTTPKRFGNRQQSKTFGKQGITGTANPEIKSNITSYRFSTNVPGGCWLGVSLEGLFVGTQITNFMAMPYRRDSSCSISPGYSYGNQCQTVRGEHWPFQTTTPKRFGNRQQSKTANMFGPNLGPTINSRGRVVKESAPAQLLFSEVAWTKTFKFW
jgi:hypothetical protein